MYVYACTIHTNKGMVHVTTCICIDIPTKLSRVYIFYSNNVFTNIDFLNHVAKQLKPSTNFVAQTTLS